eukprot:9996141-Alexandrium_andersonii.AAC.1
MTSGGRGFMGLRLRHPGGPPELAQGAAERGLPYGSVSPRRRHLAADGGRIPNRGEIHSGLVAKERH